jgi:hypothetical protein
MASAKMVKLGSLPVGTAFIADWRPEGRNVGELTDLGTGSAGVHIPQSDGSGWETTRWSLGTDVIPVDRELFNTQQVGGSERNKSKVDSPVERVWAICDSFNVLGPKGKHTVDRAKVMEKALAEGINASTAKTQFYAWRKAK